MIPSPGSSPRVRGTRLLIAEQNIGVRFIPACAGNTRTPPASVLNRPVHPRVCGKHHDDTDEAFDRIGSSPRVRGTPFTHQSVDLRRRFIPACAGNTRSRKFRRHCAPVHPRVCGEHGGLILRMGSGNGSSPRVRGTHPSGRIAGSPFVFIPACAGNTKPSIAIAINGMVHPRVCGEHTQAGASLDRHLSSSPRVRGTHCISRSKWLRCPVHPRVCGEHHHHSLGNVGTRGSSPRVRGTLSLGRIKSGARRFIPACAGNTSSIANPPAKSMVHPRVCGEHLDSKMPLTVRIGSSPRVRGTRPCGGHRGASRRFIPACAGNTMSGGGRD